MESLVELIVRVENELSGTSRRYDRWVLKAMCEALACTDSNKMFSIKGNLCLKEGSP